MMQNKIAIVTGATGGIGTKLCERLVNSGYTVIALCRKNKNIVNGVEYINGSLDSYNSVMLFTECVKSVVKENRISLIFNNAGIIAPEFCLNDDCFEKSLFVNFVAPVIIANELKNYMDSENGRIINTLSCTINRKVAIKRVPNFDNSIFGLNDSMSIVRRIKEKTDELRLNSKENFNSLRNYSITKRLLGIFTSYLYNEYLNNRTGIAAVGADPGIVNTGIITQHRWYDFLADIFFRPFIKSAKQGSLQPYRAATEELTEKDCTLVNNCKLIIFRGKLFS